MTRVAAEARFSRTFGFSRDAVKHWSGGERQKRRLALCSLVIDKNPALCSPRCVSCCYRILLTLPPSTSGWLEGVRHLVASQNGRLIPPKVGGEARTEKEHFPFAASGRETRIRVYERRVPEPVISTYDRHVSNDFSKT
jgi:hypothetical protein